MINWRLTEKQANDLLDIITMVHEKQRELLSGLEEHPETIEGFQAMTREEQDYVIREQGTVVRRLRNHKFKLQELLENINKPRRNNHRNRSKNR